MVRICLKNCKKLSIICILAIIAFVIYKLIITKIKRKRISIDIKLNKKSYGLQNGKTRRSKYLYNSKVLISTDDNGNAIKVVIENTENNSLFETMKDLMINLAKINWENTKFVIEERMEKIMDGSEFSYENLNCLSWCCGSISGNLPDNEERAFFIKTLKNLLHLVENKKGKEAKATIAANIMYLVG